MTVSLSAEVLRRMGFRPFDAGESITASFQSVSVYEPRGIAVEAHTAIVTTGTIAGINYRAAVGEGLNATCMALANDIYVNDEEEWKRQNGCSGPFLLVQVGPTEAHTITCGHTAEKRDGSITTFDSFPAARAELEALEAVALPPLLSSFACLLGGPNRQLDLRKIDRATVGHTATGRVLHEFRIQVSGTVEVSQSISTSDLRSNLQAAVSLAPRLNAKAARFFALGMAEEDQLKKFLYFFLSLEVETHAAFGRIDQGQAIRRLLDPASPPQPAAIALLQRQADRLQNLFDRFVWCAACVWPGIDDAAVQQFKELKNARDNIAHGSAAEPAPGYAGLAQQLARKVLLT